MRAKKDISDELEEIYQDASTWPETNELRLKRELTSNYLSVKTRNDQITICSIRSGAIDQMIQRILCIEYYLKKKNVELHSELQKEEVFKKIKELQAFETPEVPELV
jgi:hypothetical protein